MNKSGISLARLWRNNQLQYNYKGNETNDKCKWLRGRGSLLFSLGQTQLDDLSDNTECNLRPDGIAGPKIFDMERVDVDRGRRPCYSHANVSFARRFSTISKSVGGRDKT